MQQLKQQEQQYRPTAATRAERIQNVGPRLGGTKMKQPAFNWEAEDKYNELKNLKGELLQNYYKYYKENR